MELLMAGRSDLPRAGYPEEYHRHHYHGHNEVEGRQIARRLVVDKAPDEGTEGATQTESCHHRTVYRAEIAPGKEISN